MAKDFSQNNVGERKEMYQIGQKNEVSPKAFDHLVATQEFSLSKTISDGQDNKQDKIKFQ